MEETRRNIDVESIREPENEYQKNAPKKNTGFDAKNYLSLKLEDNENEKKLKIRIIPIDGTSGILYKQIESHNIMFSPRLQKAMKLKSQFKNYYCLKKTKGLKEEFGHKCPFCERNWEMYQKSQEKGLTKEEVEHFQDESFKCMSRPGVIMRCIERGSESDGVKFIKVNLNSKNTDLFHQIIDLYNNRRNESIEEATENNGGVLPENFKPVNILDLYRGKDLQITIKRDFDKQGNPLSRTTITVVDFGSEKPLIAKGGMPDYERINELLDDPKKWDSVFTAKPYDYLKILLDDKFPYYLQDEKRWVGLAVNADGKYTIPQKDEDGNYVFDDEAENVKAAKATKKQEEEDNLSEQIELARRESLGYDEGCCNGMDCSDSGHVSGNFNPNSGYEF